MAYEEWRHLKLVNMALIQSTFQPLSRENCASDFYRSVWDTETDKAHSYPYWYPNAP
jgi:hypothetical protein